MDEAQDRVIYDYIIAGAGSAGCVLANRLSADPKNRVLLLEGGGRDNWIWFHIPVGYLFAIGNPRADWLFKTAAEAGLNGRSLAYPRGKVLGGSSAINAMIYMRGQARDYDGWRQMGLTGWVPTVELTVHVRCRPAPGPLRVSITTRNLAGGFLEEDAEVWDSAGRLVAQSRQLARVRLS